MDSNENSKELTMREISTYQRKLNNVSKKLNDLLSEVREHYPEANYMVEGGVINIIYDGYDCDEKYSENGVFLTSDVINNLDCGLWS